MTRVLVDTTLGDPGYAGRYACEEIDIARG